MATKTIPAMTETTCDFCGKIIPQETLKKLERTMVCITWDRVQNSNPTKDDRCPECGAYENPLDLCEDCQERLTVLVRTHLVRTPALDFLGPVPEKDVFAMCECGKAFVLVRGGFCPYCGKKASGSEG